MHHANAPENETDKGFRWGWDHRREITGGRAQKLNGAGAELLQLGDPYLINPLGKIDDAGLADSR